MQTEAIQNAAYLGKELLLPLSLDVQKAGEGYVDGSTRRRVVQQGGFMP